MSFLKLFSYSKPTVQPKQPIPPKQVSDLYNQILVEATIIQGAGALTTLLYTVPLEKELFIDTIHIQNYYTGAGWNWSYLDIYDPNGAFLLRIHTQLLMTIVDYDCVLTYPLGLYVDQGCSIQHVRLAVATESAVANIHGWVGSKRIV